MGHPRWELAGRDGTSRKRNLTAGDGTFKGDEFTTWDRWDFQGPNWKVGRREEEFTAGGWASWELAGREMGRGI